MLVLKRKEGQWVDIIHHSGDVLRLKTYDIQAGAPGRLNIAFDDAARNFEIRRPEQRASGSASAPKPSRPKPAPDPTPMASRTDPLGPQPGAVESTATSTSTV